MEPSNERCHTYEEEQMEENMIQTMKKPINI